jgi:peptidoglycan hydrolase-like protein with peptidoglycan-binding domain
MSVSSHPQDIHDGGMVVRVQTALTRAGLNPGPANGVFGPPTEAAVVQFQTSRRLPATGVVDQRTWTALGLKGQVPHPVIID